MELTFQSSPYSFLHCIMREVRYQEETAETIVPDSFPDISRIVDCFADVVLRGKECIEQSILITGGVKGGILYIPDGDDIPKALDIYIPFTMRVDDPAISPQSNVICSLRVRSVEARMINSRKSLLRVGIGCELIGYENDLDELYEFRDQDNKIQTKYQTYHLYLPMEMEEKSFSIHETLDFNGHPDVSQIIKFRCELLPADQKIIGNKVVFKGSLLCKVLYVTQDHSLHLFQTVFPYSQYCELSNEYDDESLSISAIITDYDLDQFDIESAGMSIHVHVLAQCLVTGKKEIKILSDAYSIRGSFLPVWKDYKPFVLLDQNVTTQNLKKQAPHQSDYVIDSDVYWDYPVVVQSEGTRQIICPVSFHVLVEDNHQLQSVVERTEVKQACNMAEKCKCIPSLAPTGEFYVSTIHEGLEIRWGVKISADYYADHPLRTICGGSIDENKTEDLNGAVIIVRNIPANTDLWDLAKQYHTTEQEIMIANHLDQDQVLEDTILLLPVL